MTFAGKKNWSKLEMGSSAMPADSIANGAHKSEQHSGMSLAYGVNIWTHHQAPLCRELVRFLGDDHFTMCLFEPVDEERRRLGWAAEVPKHPWIAGPPSSRRDIEQLIRIVCDADVAILGHCPPEIHTARAETGKLTFIMSERLWKKPFHWWRMLNPRFARGIKKYKDVANRDNVHYLAMGTYAASDVRRIGAYGDRLWTWAYFAEVASQPPQPRTDERLRILWAGRMLKLKGVDLLLKAVSHICDDSRFGGLDVVGAGPDKSRLLRLSHKLGLGDKCVFHTPVEAHQVRELMRKADIYVFPSNRYEGWGVVANEAMSEGAVLVANDQAGAAQVLIEHGRTGFLFPDRDVNNLADTLRTLMHNAELREAVRQAAWQNMQQLWNPRVGATRLIQLSHGLSGLGVMPHFAEGPCCSSRSDTRGV